MSVTATGMEAVLQQMQAKAGLAGANSAPNQAQKSTGSFADELVASIDKMNAARVKADMQAQAFSRGESDLDLSEVMIDMQKADLALQMGVQVRNRVASAYETIMNMQV